jgi:hypothetical protein
MGLESEIPATVSFKEFPLTVCAHMDGTLVPLRM